MTEAEARAAFEHLAGLGDRIPFGYLAEGCEVRSQLMLDALGALGILAGRAWLLPVPGVVLRPLGRAGPTWRNHTAPVLWVEGTPDGARVLDPSLPGVGGPLTVEEWAVRSGLASVVRLERPESQAGMLARFAEAIMGGQSVGGFAVVVPLGVRPVVDGPGSGFSVLADPAVGIETFVRDSTVRLFKALEKLRIGR